MRKEEAVKIASIISDLELSGGSVCLNIGSSSRWFREKKQPHISSLLINPLVSCGIKFINCDLKNEPGVDLVGDVLNPTFQKEMSLIKPDILLCCNVLEHLKDAKSFASACSKIVQPGGYIIISVPLSYPYHPDPIDTMLRLTPSDIKQYFPDLEVVYTEIVSSDTFLEELLKKGGIILVIKTITKALMPFYHIKQYIPNIHRLFWLFRPYLVSVALFRKPL